MHTAATTVQLPLPDFSMPYNVACMTCTLLAMFMGSLLNVMFRYESRALHINVASSERRLHPDGQQRCCC